MLVLFVGSHRNNAVFSLCCVENPCGNAAARGKDAMPSKTHAETQSPPCLAKILCAEQKLCSGSSQQLESRVPCAQKEWR